MFDLVVGYVIKHCSTIYDWLNAKNKSETSIGIEIVVHCDRGGGL